tara:strand:+ start:2079 stop:4811 length:2733 start_codon:yes stop_codon:yes gene_type:complete
MIFHKCIRTFATACVAVVAFLPGSAAATDKVRSVEGISEFKLDNGLQVLLFPDQSKETITVNITYHVGSKHEVYGETGMAHLLEHLVFKGSTNHPEVTKELTDHGCQYNGTTWLERTNYFETFNASEENLDWALSLESDRMVNSFIAQEDLDSEMTVVRNEFERGENSPGRILYQRIYSMAYQWHNYGNSTIGSRSDIENVKIENLQAFYRKYYQPDNSTLIIAGKFDEAKALSLVEQHFGPIPKPERELETYYTRDPDQDGERQVTVRRVGSEQHVAAAYHIPAGAHEDFAPINVLSQILGSTPSGRLHKNIVEKEIATTAYAWANQQREPSLLYFSAQADTKTDLEVTKNTLIETVESIATKPITEKELERAKRKLIKNIELSFNSSQSICLQLSEWIGMGDWRLFFLNRDRIEQVLLEDVQRVADTYLTQSNRTLGYFMPTDDPVRTTVPETPNVAELLKDYKGRDVVVAGEAFDPTPENIDARTQKSEKGALSFAFLPKKTRGEMVDFAIRIWTGNEEALNGLSIVGALTGPMIQRGCERLNREEIQDELDRLKAQGRIGGGARVNTASFKVPSANVVELIEFIHELYTTPSFPESEFEQLKTSRLASLESQSTDPQALAFRKASVAFNHFPKGDTRHRMTLEEEMEAIRNVTLDDVKAFYKEFYGISNAEVSFVGDVDAKETKKVIVDLFGDWKPNSNSAHAYVKYVPVEKQSFTIETPDKANSTFIATTSFEVTRLDPDYAPLLIVNHIMGGSGLSSRLADRIRQKEGLSYGVGSFVQIAYKSSDSRYSVYAISAPENIEKVHLAVVEELERMRKDGFESEELEAAKKGFLDKRKVSLSDNGRLVGRLQSDLDHGLTMEWERALIDRIEALTLEEVNTIAKKYIHPDTMTIIKAGDFEGLKNES